MKRIHVRTARILSLAMLAGVSGWACSGDSGNVYFDQCLPDVPADECYASRRDPESEQVALALEVALRYIDGHPARREIWDWGPGVLMFAMTELYRVTGDERLRDYYAAWLDHHIEEGYKVVWSDSCPPAITATALVSDENGEAYQQVIDDVIDYLYDAPLTEDGGISHVGVLPGQPSIWVDSLFMFGMVLTRWGELSEEVIHLDLMSEQVEIFASRLQHDNGLMQHQYGQLQETDDDIYWNRGNAWVVASLIDYLRVRQARGETDPIVEQVWRDQVEGVLELQDEDSGIWWSIMNRPGEIYLETSGAALFAYGLARGYRYGFLGQEELHAAKRAVEGVKARIRYDEDNRPVVTDISGQTDPGTFEVYASVKLYEDRDFGVGAAILALIETSGLPDSPE